MSNVFDDIGTPNNPAKPLELGCVAKQPNIFDEIAKIPIEMMDPTLHRTLHQRGDQYGDYGEMSEMVQRLKDLLRSNEEHWFKLAPHERESLDMIALKIVRIVCGRHSQADSWLDIEGYAKLARDRISVQPPATP